MNNSFVDIVTDEDAKREEAARVNMQRKMQLFADEYRAVHKKATNREVKRALAKKFCTPVNETN